MSSTQTKPSSSRSRRDKDESGNPDMNLSSIGNYLFQKTVGEGNFAKVKLAKHKLTGVEVAIKVIDKTTLDEKKLSKLYREVRIMKLLHHPNIVKLYEVIETKGTVFLVMEYASGGELYDYLVVHGKMKEKEARAKFRQILSAVSYCHKKRVIHRDLKAENLLLDANLDIKIADFGFSNYFDPESKLDTFCGSPPYAAPELFQGRRYTGPEVDIWSLGVILYVLTTGCLPFDGKNLQEMRESVCRGKYRIPFYLSDPCEKLLRKFLVRDPYKRAGLEMLIDDPWINDSFTDSPISTDVSQKVEEDDNIIRMMETKYHFDRDAIIQKLRDNVYDEVSSIYYLLYYEKDTRAFLAAEIAATAAIQTPVAPVVTAPKDNNLASSMAAQSAGSKPLMMRIDEDGVLPSPEPPAPAPVQAQARPVPGAAKPTARRRRFTVGGEADMAKYAEEDEQAAVLLKKLQQPPAKDDQERPGPVGAPLPVRPVTAAPSVNVPSQQAPVVAPVLTGSASSMGTPAQPAQLSAASSITSGDHPSSDSTGAEPQRRKRHNTIVGILRGGLVRRPSEMGAILSPTADKGGDTVGMAAGAASTVATTMNTSQAMTNSGTLINQSPLGSGTIRPGEENKPRSLRFTFNSNTTSSKPPDDIVQEVTEACTKHEVKFRLPSRFLIECSCLDGIKFEIEICKLPRLKNLHGLRFKRVSGASNEYKDICEKILATVAL